MEGELKNPIIQKKISLLGDFSTGKTSLVRRFVYNYFDERYMSTLGVNISRKVVDLADHSQMRLLLWDLSGNEKFDGARSDYIRGTSGALLVGDLTRAETIARLSFFKDYLYDSNPGIPVIMIGNKVDLVEPDYETIKQLKVIADECNAPYKITSAKTGEEVESVFSILAQLMTVSQG